MLAAVVTFVAQVAPAAPGPGAATGISFSTGAFAGILAFAIAHFHKHNWLTWILAFVAGSLTVGTVLNTAITGGSTTLMSSLATFINQLISGKK